MERVRFIILCLLICTFAQAQDKGYSIGLWGAHNQHPIVKTYQNSHDSILYIRTSRFITMPKNSDIKNHPQTDIMVGLSVTKYKDMAPIYKIHAQVNTTEKSIHIDEASPMLIKLSNDNVIKLLCSIGDRDDIGNCISAYPEVWSYTIVACYDILEERIEDLKDGIKKIRIEVNNNPVDFKFKRYKKDELGEFIYKSYELLKYKVETAASSFDEGF